MKQSTLISGLGFGPLLLVLLTAVWSSCEIINPAEPIPAYIKIDTIKFTAGPGEGFPSANIPDAWIFINDNPVGGFEMPTVIPVIADGPTDILVAGGIKQNGFSTVRLRHPMWQVYEQVSNLVPTETLTVSPTVTYLGDVEFDLEDFEFGTGFAATGNSDVPLELTTDPEDVFEGARAGKIVLGPDDNFFDIRSSRFNLDDAVEVYIELDYRCNQPFDVWIRAVTATDFLGSYVLSVSPKEDWNKIYISLKDVIATITRSDTDTEYEIEFKGLKPEGQESGEILIDNFKLTHI